MRRFRQRPVDLVIDVRSQLEFWMGHLSGAVCMPVDSLTDKLAARTDISKQASLLVYCASGARSAMAAQQLKALGYTNVVDGGGINAARAEYAA